LASAGPRCGGSWPWAEDQPDRIGQNGSRHDHAHESKRLPDALHRTLTDYRAISALKHSALALDIYTWLAHRLCRIEKAGGVKISWENLRDQFGQEYHTAKDFKREFKDVLTQVCTVYPDARIEGEAGGLILRPSPPPISKTMITKPRSLVEMIFYEKPTVLV
jgi:hypothetical protein